MKSIWRDFSQMPSFPGLQGDIKTDVLIIGGGITGILTAYFLKQNGVDCVLVEKNRLCSGTTGGTSAKLTVGHGLVYHKLLKKHGEQTAYKYLRANQLALDYFKRMCENIDCDFEIKDNCVYSLNDRKQLENELIALEKIGCPCELVQTLPLPFKTVGGVRIPEQAQMNPLKFLAAIAENLTIYENTFVSRLEENTAIADSGKIAAEAIIVTTHFPFINKHGSYFLKLYQHRSYMLALKNARQVEGMYVDECKTGMSLRNYGEYLLIGGGGSRTGKRCGGWEELSGFAKEHFPQAGEYCRWAAQDCMSLDNMPYIGKYSSAVSNLLTACGFNKWGMTGAMLSAILLSDMVLQRQNEFADIFSPSRSILRQQLFINGFEAAVNLLSLRRKRCPHMGCALKYNPAEHSWDCACHGSRLDESGRVVDNPANGK